jgi:sugar porter (SP) family MFS transporter
VSTNAGQLIQKDFDLTDAQREFFVGSLNFFSIFGSAFSHWISDRFGRRRSFQVAALTFIVGLVIMSVSNSYAVLMVGRAILGLAVGFGLAIDPLYISEISTAAHRGELVTWSEMAINVGIVLGFFSGIVFYEVEDGLEWRLMLSCGCILPVIVIILSRTVMVESPRYLVGKGLDGEAKEILRTIYPPGFDIDPIAQDIKEAIEREELAEQNVGWNVILFPTPAIRRMLLVGIGTAIAQQAVGIDAIQYYLIDVLERSGIESDKAQLGVLMLLGVLKLVFVVLSSKLLDRRGRRPLLFISLIGMSVALILISFSFSGDNRGPAFAIVGLCLYLSFFSIGIGVSILVV